MVDTMPYILSGFVDAALITLLHSGIPQTDNPRSNSFTIIRYFLGGSPKYRFPKVG